MGGKRFLELSILNFSYALNCMVEIRISMFCLFGLLSVSLEETARERLTRGERLRGGKLCDDKERNGKVSKFRPVEGI